MAYWPDDMDEAEAQVSALGWALVTAGELGPHGRFRYYETPHPRIGLPTGTVMEIAEVNGRRRDYFLTTFAQMSREFNPRTDAPTLP